MSAATLESDKWRELSAKIAIAESRLCMLGASPFAVYLFVDPLTDNGPTVISRINNLPARETFGPSYVSGIVHRHGDAFILAVFL